MARWIGGGWDAVERAQKEEKLHGVNVVKDRFDRPVCLFRNEWKVSGLEKECDYLRMVPWSMPPDDV